MSVQVNKSALKDLPTNLRLVINVFGSQLNASLRPSNRSWAIGVSLSISNGWTLLIWPFCPSMRWMTIISTWQPLPPTPKCCCPPSTDPLGIVAGKMCILWGSSVSWTSLLWQWSTPIPSAWLFNYCIISSSRKAVSQCLAAIIKVTPLPVSLGPTTFLLWHLTPNVIKTTILEPVLQDGPVLLGPLEFNLQDVNTNSSGIGMAINGKILKLAWHQLCAAIFNTLCPGYSYQPQAVLEHIK